MVSEDLLAWEDVSLILLMLVLVGLVAYLGQQGAAKFGRWQPGRLCCSVALSVRSSWPGMQLAQSGRPLSESVLQQILVSEEQQNLEDSCPGRRCYREPRVRARSVRSGEPGR